MYKEKFCPLMHEKNKKKSLQSTIPTYLQRDVSSTNLNGGDLYLLIYKCDLISLECVWEINGSVQIRKF